VASAVPAAELGEPAIAVVEAGDVVEDLAPVAEAEAAQTNN
jgi:hypothetical protein